MSDDTIRCAGARGAGGSVPVKGDGEGERLLLYWFWRCSCAEEGGGSVNDGGGRRWDETSHLVSFAVVGFQSIASGDSGMARRESGVGEAARTRLTGE